MKPIDLTGQRFGKLLVVRFDGFNATRRSRERLWFCVCDCGREKSTTTDRLRRNGALSCGYCYRIKHGECRNGNESSEYVSWVAMNNRVSNPNTISYQYYGGGGVSVCERWKAFENFLADMGRKPTAQHTVDRWPNQNGNYEPGNCRWATRKEQSNNRADNRIIEANGKRQNVTQWAKELGISPKCIFKRLKTESDADAVDNLKNRERERDSYGKFTPRRNA